MIPMHYASLSVNSIIKHDILLITFKCRCFLMLPFAGTLSSTIVFHQRQICFAEIHFVAITAMTQFWGVFLTSKMSSYWIPAGTYLYICRSKIVFLEQRTKQKTPFATFTCTRLLFSISIHYIFFGGNKIIVFKRLNTD